MTFSLRRSTPAPRRRMLHASIVGGLVALLAASGAGITFALWTSPATVTSSASAATVSVSTANFTSGAFTFANHALTTRSSVTVTNTTVTSSMTAANLGIALDTASGNASLAANVDVQVWRVTVGTNCTTANPSGTVRTGTWGSFPAFTENGLLVAGAATQYCIASSASERSLLATTSGSVSISPRIVATLAVGNYSATATATTTQSTSHIYPASNQPAANTWYQIRNTNTAECVDVEGGSLPAGTALIDYPCKTGSAVDTYNQDWSFSAVGSGYLTIAARYNQALVAGVTGGSTSVGAGMQVQAPASGDSTHQQWQLQLRSTAGSVSTYQIVNRKSGLCLQPASGGLLLEQRACDGSAGQGFTLTLRGVNVPSIPTLNCADTTGTTNQTVTLSWTQPAFGTYTIEARRTAATTWTTLGTAPAGATSFAVPVPDGQWLNGTREIRVRYNDQQLVSSQVWKGQVGSDHRLRCATPAASLVGITCTSTSSGVVYAWNESAVGTYTFQARTGSGSWVTLGPGTAAAGSMSFTATTFGSLANGALNLQVLNGSTPMSSTITTLWKGQITQSGGAVLQCAAPTANFSTLTCVNSGSNSVTIGWGHPAVGAYAVHLWTVSSTWEPLTTTSQWATSATLAPGTNWDAGTRTLRVSHGGQSGTINVQKTGTANTGQTHVLRCITPTNGGAATPAPAPAPEVPAPTTPAAPLVPASSVTVNGSDGYYTDWSWPLNSVSGVASDFVVIVDGTVTDIPVRQWGAWTVQMWATPTTEYGYAATPGTKTMEIRRGSASGELIVSVPVTFTTSPAGDGRVLVNG